MEATLLGVIIALLVVILVLLLFLFKRYNNREESVVELKNALRDAWAESGLPETIGALKTYAEDVRSDYRSLDRILRVQHERGHFGEIVLEEILSDQLPPDMFGIREKVFDGKEPDANIKSIAGIICIDSKFPLDNYRKMLETDDDKEKAYFKKTFIKDVQKHLDKIARDYVHPEKGSAEFAFAFIPSESVYYFLLTEAYNELMDYVKKGVQPVSPLTLSQKIELIKAGVHAKKLSEEARKVEKSIIRLKERFSRVDKVWGVFYGHFKKAEKKIEEVDDAYKILRGEFDRIESFSEVEQE